jgi:FkbM family methyltransferase
MNRRLTKWDSLTTLIAAGVEIGSVIDVGVQRDSPELRGLFPGLPHLLFEPVSDYVPDIHKNYAGMNYTLETKAVSDRNGQLFLREIRNDADGTVSHVSPADYYEPDLRAVERVTLDGYLRESVLPKPYLVKIDVDGHETQIMSRAKKTLRDAACLIVESTLPNMIDRCLLAAQSGMVLWDIVDITYYHGCFYQADFVFVSETCIDLPRALDPVARMAFEPFDAAAWYAHQASASEA